MFTSASRDTMLNALVPTHAALCSAFPGQTFANELTGGGYARQAVTFPAAAGGTGIRTSTNAPSFSVPVGDVAWIAFATAATAGANVAVSPNGANPKEFFLSAAVANGIYSPAHGLVNNQRITFYGGTPPSGLTEGALYYAITVATDTFQVSLTSGGSVIAIGPTQAQPGCLLSPIVIETFGAAGTFNLATGATLNLNY